MARPDHRESLFVRSVAALLSGYLRVIWKTSKFTYEPERDEFYARLEPDLPVIVTAWHGQHFLVPFVRRPQDRAKALFSSHRDAEINAIAVESLGAGTIRGSGDPAGRFDRKGGVRAFLAMRRALEAGWSLVITADVPKITRVAGRGIVLLARASGRPIYPVAVATSGRIVLNNWDRSAVNLPFSRGAIVLGDPVRVPANADAAGLEACRRQVEDSLNRATQRAYEIVDGTKGTHTRG
jgi:lysophospholipid acyltransferase (LPLAT)-like uncharacterized protein